MRRKQKELERDAVHSQPAHKDFYELITANENLGPKEDAGLDMQEGFIMHQKALLCLSPPALVGCW